MGGATISFFNMVKGLRARGLEMTVVIPKHDAIIEKELQDWGLDVYICPLIMSIWGGEQKWYKKYLLLFPKILKKEYKKCLSYNKLCDIVKMVNPDIIHTNTGVIQEGYNCAKKYGIPHVWHLREYQDRDFHWQIYPSKKRFEKYLSDSYVVSITKDILHHFHLDQNHHAQTIYNGVLSKKEACLYWPKKKYFLCASRISPEKGHEETIKAFARFYKRHSDYQLCILGFGKEAYIQKLKNLARDLKCDDAISWMGFQSDIKGYMHQATALIVASHYEGFGRMTAEACFCGCVVIGRDTGGTQEILNRTGGLFFDDEIELQNRMEEVIAWDEGKYIPIVQNAQKTAIELYSVESNVDQIYNLYNEILKEKN